ncbi:hypothetical protein HPHPH45_1399 [Helicobacter pylori Hp H-45]|uniref:Uncharacterized protein n=1 Tax=Helicobacter pylori Hp H-45 TaxID=992050 RepID=I9TB23_HELPX|nr:hypothetical protein HPHPH45_1399 [Helicobacter pylori Hp H-45]
MADKKTDLKPMKGYLKSFLLIKLAGVRYTYAPCFRLAFSLIGR